LQGESLLDTKRIGIVNFAGRMLAIVAGLAFQIIVTRRLEPVDFALYHLTLNTVSTFVIPVSLITYWSSRDSARGNMVVPTALLSGLCLSLVASAAYLIFSYFFSESLGVEFGPFLLGSVILVLTYESTIVQAISSTVRPHVVGYMEITKEMLKVLAGFFCVYVLKLSLIGSLLSWIISVLSQLALGLSMIRDKVRGGFDGRAVRRWLTAAWLPTAANVANILSALDLLVLAALSSMMAVSYFSMASVLSSVILHTIALASALYPQMLVGGSEVHVDEALRFWLLFAVPMSIGLSSLAPAIAHVLRKDYAQAHCAIVLQTVGAFFLVLGDILAIVTSGQEKLSADAVGAGKPISSSSTFRMILVRLISSFIYIASITACLSLLAFGDVDAANVASLIYALVAAISLLPKWAITRSVIRFRAPIGSFLRYAVCFVPSLAFIWAFYPTGAFSERISEVLINLLPVIAVSALLYFATAAVIDPYFRGIVSTALDRVKGGRTHRSRGQAKAEGFEGDRG